MATYIAVLRKEHSTDYGVDFPDFPGCVTAGKTLEEARAFAAEALELHIEGLLEDGEEIPAPAALDAIMEDEENREGVAVLVDVPDPQPKVVRVNVTFKDRLLQEIDEYAEKRRMTRAGFLEEAALEKLRQRRDGDLVR